MARGRRRQSGTDVYHVVTRGNNRENILLENEDKNRFLGLMRRTSEKEGTDIYAYCIMTNHVHLLLKAELKYISLFMQELNSKYAFYYNSKYGKSGHVFQGRFYSSPVETESYLLSCVRYIHNNPVNAFLVKNPEEYSFSSLAECCMIWSNEKLEKKGYISGDAVKILKRRFLTREEFLQFHNIFDNHEFIDIKDEKDEYDYFRVAREAEKFIESRNVSRKEMLMDIPHLRDEFIAMCNTQLGISRRKVGNFLKIFIKGA